MASARDGECRHHLDQAVPGVPWIDDLVDDTGVDSVNEPAGVEQMPARRLGPRLIAFGDRCLGGPAPV